MRKRGIKIQLLEDLPKIRSPRFSKYSFCILPEYSEASQTWLLIGKRVNQLQNLQGRPLTTLEARKGASKLGKLHYTALYVFSLYKDKKIKLIAV